MTTSTLDVLLEQQPPYARPVTDEQMIVTLRWYVRQGVKLGAYADEEMQRRGPDDIAWLLPYRSGDVELGVSCRRACRWHWWYECLDALRTDGPYAFLWAFVGFVRKCADAEWTDRGFFGELWLLRLWRVAGPARDTVARAYIRYRARRARRMTNTL